MASGDYYISTTCRHVAMQEYSGLEEDTIAVLYNPQKLTWIQRWSGYIPYDGVTWKWS